VARLDHAGGLQLRQRFAHHRAADAERLHQPALGGQTRAGRELAVADARAERVDEPVRERARAAARRRSVFGLMDGGFSQTLKRLDSGAVVLEELAQLYDN
jgi:hypothetical protein